MRRHDLIGVVLASALAAGAPAQTPAPAPTAPAPPAHASGTETGADTGGAEQGIASYRFPWTVRVEPRAWWVSPSGSVRLPGSTAAGNGGEVKIERLNLDTPRFAPYGEVTIRTPIEPDGSGGDWRLTFGGGSYSLDRDQTTADTGFQIGSVSVNPGDAMRTGFDMTLFEATAGYRFYGYDFKAGSQRPEEAFDAALDVFAVGGVRLYDVGIEVQRLTGSGGVGGGATVADSQQVFVEPFAGVRCEMELARNFEADLQVSVGGFADSDKSSLSLDIQVGFAWRPWDQAGIQIGWRQIAYQLSDGQAPLEFEYNGRMAGLFAGVTVRF